ncbi:MAG: ATP-binding protein [Nocardioides sp.]
MVNRSRVTSGAVALVVVAAVVVYGAASGDGFVATSCYLGVLVGASVGAWIGAERLPRGRRLVPRLIAAGISLTALGDVLWTVLDLMGAGTDVSIADPPWFASYAVLCAALWVVLGRTRRRGGSRVDGDFLIDALTIVVVSVLIFWSLSVNTIVTDQSVTPFVRAVWAAYPIADAVLLALVVRVMMSRNARAAIDTSFAVGACLWLAADIAYLEAPEGAAALVLMDAAWMVAPVLLARAAWRVGETQTDAPGASALGGWVAQLLVTVGALFVPPALELTADLRGEPDRPLQLFVGTAALIALAFVRTARLIHSEERAHRELEGSRDAALAASRAKSMFLANMSHEIRTPLTTVLATAEILEDTHLDDRQLKLLGKMHRSGELLRSLVEGILDFSRIEAGQLELASTPFDLHAMVADAADVYTPRAAEAGIRFEWHLDPCVPRMVVGDPGRLFQVLTNLLDNALKFTHQGTVGLTVRSATTQGAGDCVGDVVEFVVHDTGIGIPVQDQVSVFESFRQVDGTTTRRYGGSGLGLAICKELTQLMGGSITLRSESGAGSSFVVRIPLAQGVRDHPSESRPAGTHSSIDAQPAARTRTA